MASYVRFCSITIFFFFFFCFFLSMSSSQKVTLSLYYEALCPFCADFIVNHLPQIFQNGLISAIDLRLVPWGNSGFKPDGTIHCQHGEAECALNAIHACVINAYPDVMKHVGYIYCTERLVLENKLEQWADCFEMVGLSRAALDCYINGYGHQLELKYAEETSELNPAHTYVPWVVVNNQPLQENYQKFVMFICNTYGSNQLQEACRKLNHSAETLSAFTSLEKLSYSHQVCYANQ